MKMKGKVKLIRDEKSGFYKLFVRNYFWQRWKPLKIDGKQLTFKTFKEFAETTKIEDFGAITLEYDNYQGSR